MKSKTILLKYSVLYIFFIFVGCATTDGRNNSSSSEPLDGKKVFEEAYSRIDEGKGEDALVHRLVRDWPSVGLNAVMISRPQIKYQQDRSISIEISRVDILWREEFRKALQETLKIISVKKSAGSSYLIVWPIDVLDLFKNLGPTDYYIRDDETLNQFKYLNERQYLKFDIIRKGGGPSVRSYCLEIEGYFDQYSIRGGPMYSFDMAPRRYKNFQFNLEPSAFAEIADIELSVVKFKAPFDQLCNYSLTNPWEHKMK